MKISIVDEVIGLFVKQFSSVWSSFNDFYLASEFLCLVVEVFPKHLKCTGINDGDKMVTEEEEIVLPDLNPLGVLDSTPVDVFLSECATGISPIPVCIVHSKNKSVWHLNFIVSHHQSGFLAMDMYVQYRNTYVRT